MKYTSVFVIVIVIRYDINVEEIQQSEKLSWSAFTVC